MAMSQRDFLSRFMNEDGLLAIAHERPNNLNYYASVPDIKGGVDIFFGPAVRRAPGGAEKEDVLGTKVLWVDVDNEQPPKTTLPPSVTNWSGHGWHLYWEMDQFIDDPALIEELNQILMKDAGEYADSCWNVNRVLRVPGTTNSKPPRAEVEIREHTAYVYSIEDIRAVAALDDRTKQKIFTGDQRGYRSRSERDWSVVTALVNAGASDKLIEAIFNYHAIGDKYRDKETPAAYFERTLEKARVKATENPKKARKVVEVTLLEREDGYWMSGNVDRRVSTFIIHPKVLLDGNPFGSEDAIIVDISAGGYTWYNITFSRGAFTSVARFDKECPVAAWQWLGSDNDLRKLLPYLLDRLRDDGLPKVAATPTLGLHFVKGVPYFVADKETMSPDNKWLGYEGPLAWLPSKKEHPEVALDEGVTKEELARLARLLPQINEPSVIWPMIGWYAATVFKPWLKQRNVRFPVLNVTGTRGSGKTTLIQRVFMRLLGQTDPKSYDAGTTRFVTLALMGGTNANPIAFSEFRYESVANFLRYILLSYDTGHDPRGRADQTTVDYPLDAPYSIDGEDMIADPAAQERIVVAQLHPKTVEEGTPAYDAFQELLEEEMPSGFGGYYIRKALNWIVSGEADETLKEAKRAVFKAFPKKLPDRVRNNHIVAYFGILCFVRATGMEAPAATVLDRSIKSVCNLDTGRSRSLVDEFVEAVANAVNQGNTQYFKWSYDAETESLFFQMAPTHNWWLTTRRHSGRSGLEKDAIRAQLKESIYSVEPRNINGMYMHGVSLKKAQECGLDVPNTLGIRELRIQF